MTHKSPINVLIVEADDVVALDLKKLLKKLNHLIGKITRKKNLKEAVSELENEHYDLIFTNLFLSDSKGLPTFHVLKEASKYIPIILISHFPDDTLALEAISLGAQDFISKADLNVTNLSRSVRYALERHSLQEMLRTLSFTDELTGLYNRRGMMTLAERQLLLSNRTHTGFYLFFIDLDHLKEINDTFGHHEGDMAIAKAGQCLSNSFRSSDIVARIGGDEFAVIAVGVPKDKGKILVSHIDNTLKDYNENRQHTYTLSLSVGMAYWNPDHPVDIETLLEAADDNLYLMKRKKLIKAR